MTSYVHEERFWSKVDASGDCWVWTASVSIGGYGKYSISSGGKTTYPYAHRHSYSILVGDVPAGMDLDHVCRNRRCVNPDHLEPVTHRENLLRGGTLAGVNARKTHCKNGHEFTEENTRTNGKGRACMTCHRAWDKARYARDGRRG